MFSELLLDEPLLDALDFLGFEKMTAVQIAAIPRALAGKDLIVNAKTGSGKTLAYVLPMLQQILDNPQSVTQALILAPTRELCRQINKQCSLLSQYTEIRSAIIIGGEDPKHQLKALQKYPDIIVATPGRLLEHVKREVIELDAISILVIDEADRMLDMGFSEEVISIAAQCNEECQTLLYSASFSENKFKDLTDIVLVEAEKILIDSARENNQNIIQYKMLADNDEHKLDICHHLLNKEEQHINYNKAIVFANKKETVNRISGWLQSKNITSAVLHSDVEQDRRNSILRKFRNKSSGTSSGAWKHRVRTKGWNYHASPEGVNLTDETNSNDTNILVATDVASRGLDINDLDLIINFDVPRNGEDYMHRIGRTGRMFNVGSSVTLVSSREWNKMIGIENFLQLECTELKIKSLAGKFKGPENTKTSGKAYGAKRKKDKPAKKEKSRIKKRLRDKKNIGKRRKPSEENQSGHHT